ncbi:MAG TPA: histidine kinase dimerization/phosphoacceptor domain -containing protein [Alphaproteobacteria bacterium]|nr:histidine kinase dimerization/phosphoacceptor domain -containing protein [Alphaproteobacteria bacterium]
MTSPESIPRTASAGAQSTTTTSTRFRLALVFAVLLLPIVVFGVLVSKQQARDEEVRARQNLEEMARIAIQPAQDLFSGTERLFKGLVEQPDIRDAGQACDADLERVRAAIGDYRSLSVLDGTGKVTCSSRAEIKGSAFADEATIGPILRADRLTVISESTGDASVEPAAMVLLPWRNGDGTPAGAMVAELSARRFALVAAGSQSSSASRLYLLDSKGNRLDGSRPLPAALRDTVSLQALLHDGEDQIVSTSDDGTKRLFVAIPMRSGGVTALYGLPVREAPFAERFDLIGLATFLWLGGILIAWLLADWVVARPLRKLAAALDGAEPDARPRAVGPAELAKIAHAIAAMAGRIVERERALEEAIATRDAMLREIHHRVKNNLQIVTSLLNIQAKTVQGHAAGRAFGEIQTRVRALALVHRYLYESGDLKSVNLGAFLKELAASLQLSHGISEEQVVIEVEAEEVWDVSDRAVPLALFMTEAMTNALKHAFPEGRRGLIRVVLRQLGEGVVRFSVEDNGVGLPETRSDAPGRQASLGMSLIKAFARQVDAKLMISGPPGTVIAIEFVNKIRAAAPAGELTAANQSAG